MARYTNKNRNDDFNWYVKNLQKLYNKYGKAYLFISNKKVLGAFNTITEGLNKLKDVLEDGKYIIQESGPDESAYTVTNGTVILA